MKTRPSRTSPPRLQTLRQSSRSNDACGLVSVQTHLCASKGYVGTKVGHIEERLQGVSFFIGFLVGVLLRACDNTCASRSTSAGTRCQSACRAKVRRALVAVEANRAKPELSLPERAGGRNQSRTHRKTRAQSLLEQHVQGYKLSDRTCEAMTPAGLFQ